ncbi:SDR family oxidoreductase [Yoonia sp. SS1-5]|uniref:SDR family NAD(P)-dependent oxidoreductase n=1 Tax=Yoonia rhodophyticola TaxID=3137370 RepID=A0AAN0NM27_9RHOB
MNLENRHIIVTGAGAGIGLGIARQCIAAKARVTGFDISDTAADQLAQIGADFVPVDVSEASGFAAAIRSATENAGQLDGLVNNAGVTIQAPLAKLSTDQMEKMWGINQRSVLVGCQTAAGLLGRGGAIVNIASNHARCTDAGSEAYAGTKGAIVAMTRAMAWSLGPQGIRVNALCPGMTRTEIVEDAMRDPALDAKFRGWGADNEVSTVDEIGKVAVFLLSDAAMALNGSDVVADRGMSARLGANF